MNILISKNDTTRFGEMTSKKKTWGGFDVAALMFINLVKAYPQHTFYFYGTGDCEDYENELPNNMINLFGLVRKNIAKRPHYKYEGVSVYHYEDIYKYVEDNNITFDKAVIWFCRPTALGEFDKGYISPRTNSPRTMLVSEVAGSPPFALIKHYNLPTIYIIDDLMEVNRITQDVPQPYAIYSQFNGIDKSKFYSSINTQIERQTPVTYKQIEKLWLQGKQKVDWRNFEKTNRFILTVNAGPFKARYIKKWIWDKMPDTICYGNWFANKHYREEAAGLGIDVDKMCKNIPMSDMEDLMFNTRYTLVVPAQPNPRKKSNANFVTQKVYSMIYYGIIPFWCKYDYDSNNLYADFPDFLKVETPEEFYEKMDILDNNHDLYTEIKNKLYDLLEDKYFTLDFIHEIYDSFLNE